MRIEYISSLPFFTTGPKVSGVPSFSEVFKFYHHNSPLSSQRIPLTSDCPHRSLRAARSPPSLHGAIGFAFYALTGVGGAVLRFSAPKHARIPAACLSRTGTIPPTALLSEAAPAVPLHGGIALCVNARMTARRKPQTASASSQPPFGRLLLPAPPGHPSGRLTPLRHAQTPAAVSHTAFTSRGLSLSVPASLSPLLPPSATSCRALPRPAALSHSLTPPAGS